MRAAADRPMDKRPTVFIGSSSEGLPVANALSKRFGDTAIVDVWDAGNVFRSMELPGIASLIASSFAEPPSSTPVKPDPTKPDPA